VVLPKISLVGRSAADNEGFGAVVPDYEIYHPYIPGNLLCAAAQRAAVNIRCRTLDNRDIAFGVFPFTGSASMLQNGRQGQLLSGERGGTGTMAFI